MRALLILMRSLVLAALLLAAATARAAEPLHPVGISPLEFTDGDRQLALWLFYPAESDGSGKPFILPFAVNLNLTADATPDFGDTPRPLIMFSHGRGSNGLLYAWFYQYLAERGYIVAAINHYRANTYDSSIVYLANKLWQRPVDLKLAIDFLLAHPKWGSAIDARRIGVAGHSQGGFTSLWIGGAKVNAQKYLAFQTGWRNNKLVPQSLRDQLPLDPKPALDVHDDRIKAAFAMAPGIIQAFGMDEAGLAQMKIPAFIAVGARDTQTPPGPNAEFAAKHIPGARLMIIPGLVDHEIFVNECDQEGRDEFPEACIDAEGVDRAAIHRDVAKAALEFFDASMPK